MSLVLLLGGAASGKSRLAVERVGSLPGPPGLIATAEPGDEEMAVKIRRHRRDRPEGWVVVEEPVDLEGAIDRFPPASGLVLDCLTLWVSNLLGGEVSDEDVVRRADRIASGLAAREGESVVVSNEVGSGIVPVNAVARRYRELLGRVNATFARQAERTLLVVAGGVVRVRPTVEAWDE